MNAIDFCEINLNPKNVAHFLFRDGLISASFHRNHEGVPNEFREMGFPRVALRLDHGQKGWTDSEPFD
jgi:hypothetical protein